MLKGTASYIKYFTVLYPNGTKATYGFTNNTSAKLDYPITLWEDKLGNRIEYSYDYSNSVYYVSQIVYKHSSNITQTGNIVFNYSNRTDGVSHFRAGESILVNKLLSSVTSYFQGNLIYTYQLTHSVVDEVNQLSSLDCYNSTTNRFPPLLLSYGESDGPGPQEKDIFNTGSIYLSEYYDTTSLTTHIYDRGKFAPNCYNDGLLIYPLFETYDIVNRYTEHSPFWYRDYYQYGSKYAPDQRFLFAPQLANFSTVYNSIMAESGFQYIGNVDVDGDGIDEVVKVNYISTSTSSETTTLRIKVYGYAEEPTPSVVLKKNFTVMVNGIVQDGPLVSPQRL